ncbi:hypothetical protein BH11BAC3_BH11BAC3_00460 [soil metagenome]
MLKIFNLRLLPVMCFLLAIGMGTSCKKDDAANTGEVKLLSFGPTGARPGDTLKFIGLNLNKVTNIELSGGASVAQAGFLSQTSELILIIVPQQTQRGYIMLKTPDGDIQSKTILNLLVPLTVTSITPQARPGENITINGQYLNWVTQVKFNNDKIADSTSIVSKSLTQLVVKVPMDAQSGPLVIYYGGTEPGFVETADTLIVTLPAITAIAPNPVKHANNITITGTNLDLVSKIIFPNVGTPVTTFVSQSASQIVVKVPGASQTGKLTLVAASGVTVTSSQDMAVLFPVITAMSPNPIDPLADLTITGTDLDLVTGISFTGGIAPVTNFVSQSATKIVINVPAGSLKGKLTFNILNSSLTVQSATDLVLNGGLPPLADFAFAIYTDALQNTFQDWSYSDVHDFNSTANVRQGTKSIRVVYAAGGYQGVTFHAGTAASTAGYSALEFSVFGEAGTGGKKINVVVNGNYGSPAQVTVLEGEWSTFSVSMSSIGSPATIGEVVLQSAGFGGVVHIDHMGFR